MKKLSSEDTLKTMNKGRRQEIKQLKYRKRIKKLSAKTDIYINSKGVRIYNPKAIDIIKDNGQLCYKNTSTPCSCSGCKPPEKDYKRHEKHKKSLTEL